MRSFYRFNLDKGVAYYIVNGNELTSIENAGKTKVITISLSGKEAESTMPKTVLFKHHKANFTIQLTKIDTHVDE